MSLRKSYTSRIALSKSESRRLNGSAALLLNHAGFTPAFFIGFDAMSPRACREWSPILSDSVQLADYIV